MKLPVTKEWFEKRAAAEGDHEIGAGGNRKTMTVNLTDDEIAELERLVRPASPHWRCFHCDEVFYDTHSAKAHFGMDQCSDPACKIKMGAEGSLVTALRRVEAELSDAWAAIHNETTEAAKAYYAQQSRHGEQLRAAEEAGYERGLADGRAEATPDANHQAPGRETPEYAAALAAFTEYFVRNYPGPDTIIYNPHWHAPKIFAAAVAAVRAALTQEHAVTVAEVGDPEAWLFHATPPIRPQAVEPRWMSINQINEHIAALEGELRSRAATAPEASDAK